MGTHDEIRGQVAQAIEDGVFRPQPKAGYATIRRFIEDHQEAGEWSPVEVFESLEVNPA